MDIIYYNFLVSELPHFETMIKETDELLKDYRRLLKRQMFDNEEARSKTIRILTLLKQSRHYDKELISSTRKDIEQWEAQKS